MAVAYMSTQRHPRLEPSGMDDGACDDEDHQVYDKQWATKYILGPLYEPEPSEESATRIQGLPVTSPPCASPTRPTLGTHRRRSSFAPTAEHPEELPLLRRILSRSNSLSSKAKPLPPQPKYYPATELERKRSLHTANPPTTRWNQGTLLTRSYSVASSRPTVNESNKLLIEKGWGVRRTVSLAEHHPRDQSHRFVETLTQKLETLAQQEEDQQDTVTMARQGEFQPATGRPRRSSSLRERYPGDMSHRPLAMLERDYRAADRAPNLHNPRHQQPIDIIDTLDSTATFHHEGPYDATMASRNRNKKYSPVEAVKDTNMEALKATPQEYVQDSLVKHVPLQGTAVVPPGMQDIAGRTMEYQEGTDMMREGAAGGGQYKRWEGYQYHPDDLKGKGEPSYTIEKQLKDHKHRSRSRGYSLNDTYASKEGRGATMIEMQPRSTHHLEVPGANTGLMGDGKEGNARVRQRSVSNAAATGTSSGYGGYSALNGDDGYGESSGGSGIRRSNTTGKNIAQSLKRRLGSIRRKREEV